MKLWEKQYKLNKAVENFTVGSDYMFDLRLVKYDCIASIAHAKMLRKVGLLTSRETKRLVAGLEEIISLAQKNKFKISPADEDCHTAIENFLTKRLGEVGKKIHTARSRNDQVLTALRLYYKDNLKSGKQEIVSLIGAIKRFRSRYGKIRMAGYTHMRKAMPSSINLWASAFIDALADDIGSLDYAFKLVDYSPLGTAAGYGSPINVDRKFTAQLLGFAKIQQNPIYVQNSRGKFESAILHALGQIMYDLNRLASDLILFSMSEFGFFELPKEFCTGSSIMPHKKNPDVLELLRAKYHLVIAWETGVRGIAADLISGYNRDLQLLKEPVMKSFDIVAESLVIFKLIFQNLKVNQQNCEKSLTEELYAAEQAYRLVKKGLSFREAYKIISKRYS